MNRPKKLKKILYVLDNFPKLSETFILNEIVELAKRGFEIKIISRCVPEKEVFNDDVWKFKLLEKTFYLVRKNILKVFIHYRFYYYMFIFLKILIRRENRVFNLNSVGQGNRLLSLFRLWVNLSVLASLGEDPDMIHSHFAADASVYGLLLSEALGKPFTFTAHAYEIFCSPDIKTLKSLLKRANCAITPSLYNKKYMEEITGLENCNFQILRATIDQEKFLPSNKTFDGIIKIIGVGRLIEKKGFEYLIRGMEIVIKRHQNVLLFIAGTGPMEETLNALIEERNLKNHVQLVGALSNEECQNLLNDCWIGVLPCIVAKDGDRDVCPLTLQEAMAMELPVVSTFVGSIPELIDDGINGILVPEKDEEALANAIIRLLDHPDLRVKMGKNGREKILREFNIKKQVDKLLSIWEEISSSV